MSEEPAGAAAQGTAALPAAPNMSIRWGQPGRAVLLRRALGLEYVTVGWNIVEGVVALAAAALAGSVALLGFGLDSFVESASGGVLIWRILAERKATNHGQVEALERRAGRLVGLSLFALATFVGFEAVRTLAAREEPEPSLIGIALTAVSVIAMGWLAQAKRTTARRLGSKALEADAFQTSACLYLSLIVLAGIGLNALFGWWWADPAAALLITIPLVTEGRKAWNGDFCCDV